MSRFQTTAVRTASFSALAAAALALSLTVATPAGAADTRVTTATTAWETAPVGKDTTAWETAPVGKDTTAWE
ncbi:hypothetical protein ACIPY6_42125 [Streptomyces sp. NPDC090054]|uniref:hypothetical protein n=1 Tax=Streptomyces sp. NPDC090054 TaxID=3365933 RepID=UPI00382F3850